MIQESVNRLSYLCDTIPPLLNAIGDSEFSYKPAPGQWSKKEIIGHLIDSAANNHQRFIRIQFENEPHIQYDQVNWNLYGHYNKLDKSHVIDFWTRYNKHLVEIVKRIPEHNLNLTSRTTDNKQVTLGFLVNDYVQHMEHHLRQVVAY